jgi:hypothetical protein
MVIRLINLKDLKEHEEVNLNRLRRLKNKIKKEMMFKKPIAVDKKTNIIIDGHARFNSLKELGYSKIPAYAINYNSPKILVKNWKGNKKLTKKDILVAGLKGKKLPPKTSKNMIRIGNKIKHISFIEKRVGIPLELLKGD